MAEEGAVEKRAPRMLRNELGRTGLKHHSGVLYEEFLPKLQGTRAVQQYREMRDNSAIVGSMLFAVESLLRSVDWTVEPKSEAPADMEAAKFLEECMNDLSHTWEDFISEVLSMLVYGWSYFEVVWKKRGGPDKKNPKSRSKYDDGRWGWRKFAFRSQDTLYRWELQDDGGIKGMHQMPPPAQYSKDGVIFLPIEKCLLFRTTSHKNSPEGRSILRNAYRSYFFAQRLEQVEAIGVERDLAGMPVMWAPPEILSDSPSAEEAATYELLKSVVSKVKRDEQEGILLPLAYDENGKELYRFELLNTGGRRSFSTGEIIQRYTQQIAMTILADFVLLGHENVGSFALSSDKTELFAVALGSWLDSIEEVINRYAVPQLFELNVFDIDQPPRIKHGDIETPNLVELAQYIQQLSGAGAPLFPNLILTNHLLHLAGLPEMDEEQYAQQQQEMVDMQQSMAAAGAAGSPSGNGNGNIQQFAFSFEDLKPEALERFEKAGGNPFAPPPLTPSYFDGTNWKPVRSRHTFKKK